MLTPDVEARRMLVREHRAELALDALQPATTDREVVTRGARRRRLRLLVTRSVPRPRPDRSEPLEQADGGRALLEES